MLRAASVVQSELQNILSNNAPTGEAVAPVAGAGDRASRDDHKHPRLTSATIQTLNASGEAPISFTRSFAGKPAVVCLLYETADGQPVVFKVRAWAQDANGSYTGCTIKGARSAILPMLSNILLIGPLIAALANFNVFGGSAAGAEFCCIALQPSS